jgi:hypothetical protein
MWLLFLDNGRSNFHLGVVAELPQLFSRPRVLGENLIDVEGIKIAGAMAIDGLSDVGEEFVQLRLVVVRDQDARRSSLRLVRHANETSPERAKAAAVRTTSTARYAADERTEVAGPRCEVPGCMQANLA